jgi:putative FmdB family regulatory protein
MPIYDYLCPTGHRFEVIHGVNAEGPATCPICHEAPVRKAISAPSIHFKGTGWAKKDRTTRRPVTAGAESDDTGPAGDAAAADATAGTEKAAADKPAPKDKEAAPQAASKSGKRAGATGDAVTKPAVAPSGGAAAAD